MVDYEYIRKKHLIEGWSIKKLVRTTGHSRGTIRKILRMEIIEEPRYQLSVQKPCPIMDPYKPVIEHWLKLDEAVPTKQRHTAKRIFDRLVDEYGFTGSEASVRRLVAGIKKKPREAFIPLDANWGEQAQVDWGRIKARISGVETEVCLFVMRLKKSRVIYAWASHTEKLEAFLEGHVRAFEWFGGVPRVCVYDNLKTAVVKILAGPLREEHQRFSALRTHYLFDSEFCAPRKGNQKGSVEHGVGYVRRNTMVPERDVESIEELNDILLDWCEKEKARLNDEWLQESKGLKQLPINPFKATITTLATVNSLCLITIDRNRYSVPSRFVGESVRIELSATLVEVFHKDKLVATHFRVFGRNKTELVLKHYLDVLEYKPRSSKNATVVRQLPEAFQIARKKLCENSDDPLGYKEFCQILLLHREHSLAELEAAIKKAINIGLLTSESVKQLIIQDHQFKPQVAPVPDSLKKFCVTQHDTSQYNSLLKGVAS
jgi:transposase